jgi:hypothetical protein
MHSAALQDMDFGVDPRDTPNWLGLWGYETKLDGSAAALPSAILTALNEPERPNISSAK